MKHTTLMEEKYGDPYRTPPGVPATRWVTPRFMAAIALGPLLRLWWRARRHILTDADWVKGSNDVAAILENLGGRIEVTGLEKVRCQKEPCVFIANHMSTLETFLLPGMIRPFMPVTFVVKKSLVTMPIFGPIMQSRNPVIVGRANPREDLHTVLSDGLARIASGYSIVIFPQHTRTLFFDETQFNTIGIKLAQKAGVKVIPIALKTDAWGQGRRIKELGPIRPDLPARFHFGEPLAITGKGKAEHQLICQFIRERVSGWQTSDGINHGHNAPSAGLSQGE